MSASGPANPDPKTTRTAQAEAFRAQHAAGERKRRNAIVGAVVAVVLLVVIGVAYALTSQQDTSGQKASSVPSNLTGDYGVVVGKGTAPVTVTIYEDFLCPACGQFEAASHDYLQERLDAGDIKVDYRMIAFLDEASADRYSTRAANAFAAVLDTTDADTAIKYHRALYGEQPAEGGPGLSNDTLINLAVEVGADEATIRSAVENEKFGQWVVNATDQSSKDGIAGTPTVKVDGETVKNPYTDLDAAIEAALKAAPEK
jgi:protein-disulfide isomerase